jgi:uncharacterized protein YciI
MHYCFYCLDRPDAAELRRRTRPEHIRYMMRALERAAFGGPLIDEASGASIGSVYAIDFPDRAAAEAFLAEEPYYKAGLFQSVELRPWRQMAPEREPGFLQRELERELAAAGG